jgi:hypothetical protein
MEDRPMLRLPRFLPRTLAAFGAALVLLLGGVVPGAHAAGNYVAKLLLQPLAVTTKNQCARSPLRPVDCVGYDTVNNLALYPSLFYTYVLVVNGSQSEGIAGASVGIDYDGAPQSGFDVYSWHLCGDAEAPDAGWPAPGSGNIVTFNGATNCQTTGNANIGAVAVLGYFYSSAYTPDVVELRPHPGTGTSEVWNCAGVADEVYWDADLNCRFFGAAAFGGPGGKNPCGSVAGNCPGGPRACLTGPSTVIVGTVTRYQDMNYPSTHWGFDWSVTGPAQVIAEASDRSWIDVQATGPGTYTVEYTACPTFPHAACSNCLPHSVVVEEAVPTIGTTWGRIKALVR